MLKPLLVGLFFFIALFSSQAQVGLHVAQMRPLGEMGMIFEKQIGFGFTYNGEFDDKWRTGLELTHFKLRQRLDPIPIVGLVIAGSSTFVSLGTQRFTQYNIIYLDGFFDRALIEKEKFELYVGGGITAGAASVSYESSTPRIADVTYGGGGFLGGLFLRAGYDYHLTNKLTAGLSGVRRVYAQEDAGIFGNYTYRLAFTYGF
jgi:hypothetical protein